MVHAAQTDTKLKNQKIKKKATRGNQSIGRLFFYSFAPFRAQFLLKVFLAQSRRPSLNDEIVIRRIRWFDILSDFVALPLGNQDSVD